MARASTRAPREAAGSGLGEAESAVATYAPDTDTAADSRPPDGGRALGGTESAGRRPSTLALSKVAAQSRPLARA